jgi:transposase
MKSRGPAASTNYSLPTKLKQKISGCFRGESGGKIFSRIRGYVSTLRKNDLKILDGIQSAFHQSPNLPAHIFVTG